MATRPPAVLIALCTLGLGAPGAWAMSAAELFAKLAPSVWGVRVYDAEGLPFASGSSVVIGPGTLITNCHVLKKASRFSVVRGKVNYPAVLELWDTERDLCQIKAQGLSAPPVEIADVTKAVVGQTVYALGDPKGLELTLSGGLVSSLRLDKDQRLQLIQTSAATSHGSSGGGLFDEQGRVLGITSSGMDDAQNLNFAVPASWIAELPQRQALHAKTSVVAPPRFDGDWKVVVSCPALPTGVSGYRFEFPARIQDGYFSGRHGQEGAPGSMLLEGNIDTSGHATLAAKGLTGDARYNYDKSASMLPYVYHVEAQFDSARGAGRRIESRECALAFARL